MSRPSLYYVVSDQPKSALTDKCIVIDLDQTLVATQDEIESLHRMKIMSDPNLQSIRKRTYQIQIEDLEQPGIGTHYEFWGVIRPHTREFLTFCFSYFKVVAVWSAGERKYVHEIVDYLFKDLPKPHVIFTKDDIVSGTEKPLRDMFESNNVLRRHMTHKNTWALDDNTLTFVHNLNNAILIPPYEPALNLNAFGRDDPTLVQLQLWLQLPEVAGADDVRLVDTKRIFSVPVEEYRRRLALAPGLTFH